jgi:hypothetical protein
MIEGSAAGPGIIAMLVLPQQNNQCFDLTQQRPTLMTTNELPRPAVHTLFSSSQNLTARSRLA